MTAQVTKRVRASRERVWAELSDGWMFTSWVVGATHIRDVDPDWPQPGAHLHHSVGAWPLTISDTTEVLECEAPERLVLQARAWPAGEARVEFTLRPDADDTVVTMVETPTAGPARRFANRAQDAALYRRNKETLDRLADIAEKRPLPGFPTPGAAR